MISLDTVKMMIPAMCFEKIDFNGFNKINGGGKNQSEFRIICDNNLIKGLKSITCKYPEEEVVIELSSKILGIDSCELITKRNIYQVYKKILETECFSFDYEVAYNNTYVLSCDVTNDIVVDKQSDFIRLFALILNLHRYCKLDLYKGQSLVVTQLSQKGKPKKRLTFYDKYKESKNENYKHILRVEQNIKKFSDLRTVFNLEKEKCNSFSILNDRGYVSLKSILQSNESPNYKLLDQLVRESLEDNELPPVATKLVEFEKKMGRKQIAIECDNNMFLIRKLIKSFSKYDVEKKCRYYKQIVKENTGMMGTNETMKQLKIFFDALKEAS